MGGKCSRKDAPDYSNVCSSQIGDLHTIPGFCGTASACKNISSEWDFHAKYKCSCKDYQIVCRRTAFNGDPKTCCLNNYNFNKIPSNCFSDSAQKNTCDPKYRDSTSPGCREVFNTICIVESGRDEDFSRAWEDGFCRQMIGQNLLGPSGELNPPDDVEWTRQAMSSVFSKYFSTVGGIRPPGDEGSFQRTLFSLCTDYPAACETALRDLCGRYGTDDVEGNSNIANFCGCHLPESSYALYEDLFSISKICTPLCAHPTTIPVTDDSGVTQVCRSSVCVIDNVTLNYFDSQGGNIDFKQVCGGCEGAASCRCFITGISIEAAESKLSGINLEQNCQGALDCYRQGIDGRAIKVDCNDPNKQLPNGQGEQVTEVHAFVTAALAVLLAIVVILGGVIVIQQLTAP